jgi:hypothetical protein
MSVAEVEREIQESELRIKFIREHSVQEIAAWIKAGSPV